MVAHFQKLFDVTSLSGVYPRMNEVYTRLGEMTNMTRNLRDILELGDLQLGFTLLCGRNQMIVNVNESIFVIPDSRVLPLELVSHVARLASSTEHATAFQTLLRDDDIDRLSLYHGH